MRCLREEGFQCSCPFIYTKHRSALIVGLVEQDNVGWRDALKNPQAAGMGWGGSESPCFVGRAVAALVADPNVGRKNGGIYTTRSLSQEYGFSDVDGARPDYAVLDAAFEVAKTTFLAPMMEAARFANIDWKLTPKAGPLET